jgi:hypothetical protein
MKKIFCKECQHGKRIEMECRSPLNERDIVYEDCNFSKGFTLVGYNLSKMVKNKYNDCNWFKGRWYIRLMEMLYPTMMEKG